MTNIRAQQLGSGNIDDDELDSVDNIEENIQAMVNKNLGSTGLVSGGAITDAGGGNIDVDAIVCYLRTTDSAFGELKPYTINALSGLAIPSDSARYIGVEYNGGTPQIVARTSSSWNRTTEFGLGSVVNESGTLHINNNPEKIVNGIAEVIHRLYEVEGLRRADQLGGLIIGETGTRNITVSAGEMYDRLNEFSISAIDTSGTDSFDTYLNDVKDGSGIQQWDNQNYNNGGVKTALIVNWYANHWWYIEPDGNLVKLYGNNQYVSAAQAQNEDAPAIIPLRLSVASRLIAQTTFQKGASAYTSIRSRFDNEFNSTLAALHNLLGNLGWTVSNHTGGINKLAGFGASGEATEIDQSYYEVADPTILKQANVIDNLSSSSAVDPLSANQGRLLKVDLDALRSSYSRRTAVINIVDNTQAPPTEVLGDRYILDNTAGGVNSAWDGASINDIVEFNGTTWDAVSPLEGYIAYVDSQNKDALFVDDGTPQWELRNVAIVNHNDLNNIQGGTTNEYYHLTQSQYTSLSGIVEDPVWRGIGSYSTGVDFYRTIVSQLSTLTYYGTLRFQIRTYTSGTTAENLIDVKIIIPKNCFYDGTNNKPICIITGNGVGSQVINYIKFRSTGGTGRIFIDLVFNAPAGTTIQIRDLPNCTLSLGDVTGIGGGTGTGASGVFTTPYTQNQTNMSQNLPLVNRAPVSAPSTSSDTGTQGDWSFSGTEMFFCVDTDTWVKWTVTTSF